MILQRCVLVCDEPGCEEKSKGTLKLSAGPVAEGLSNYIVLRPFSIIIDKDDWLVSWDGEKSATYCPKHAEKSNKKRRKI